MAELRKLAPSEEFGGTEDPALDKQARLEYLRQMLIELRAMASGLDSRLLVYLLEMSVLEAAACSTSPDGKNSPFGQEGGSVL